MPHEFGNQLARTGIFSTLPAGVVKRLAAEASILTADAGEKIRTKSTDYIVLVEGELEVYRLASNERLGALAVEPGSDAIGCLYSVPPGAIVLPVKDIRYAVFDGGRVDELLSWVQQARGGTEASADEGRQIEGLHMAAPFRAMSRGQLQAISKAMETVEMQDGDHVINQGDKGDFFYYIESGSVDVWRTNPLTERTSRVARLEAGATFGEEALVQEGFRNATVVMTSPGKLLRLEKEEFDRLVKSQLVGEIDTDEAHKRLQEVNVELLDCRYEMENEVSRIPGGQLIPLDQLRELAGDLRQDKTYIVYCRSGRRSKAAAFLLRQMGYSAKSMRGGITGWPFEIEGDLSEH